MRIIPFSDFITTPWKNGGGVTREIARDVPGEDFGWRLSVAEVVEDGPFSLFPAHHRWLTVIEGAGMRLASKERTIEAQLLRPVEFPGGEAITGRLLAGPCRDFNLIYHPQRFAGFVRMAVGESMGSVSGPAQGITGLYVVDGIAKTEAGDILGAGDFAFLADETETIILSEDATVIAATLVPRTQSPIAPDMKLQ